MTCQYQHLGRFRDRHPPSFKPDVTQDLRSEISVIPAGQGVSLDQTSKKETQLGREGSEISISTTSTPTYE